MSMSREKAIEILNDEEIVSLVGKFHGGKEALEVALTTLRSVSREMVEKVWRGCEYCKKHKINLVRIEMNYNDSRGSPERLNPTRVPKFCPICGKPLTSEAVQMVMERLNKMEEMKK